MAGQALRTLHLKLLRAGTGRVPLRMGLVRSSTSSKKGAVDVDAAASSAVQCLRRTRYGYLVRIASPS